MSYPLLSHFPLSINITPSQVLGKISIKKGKEEEKREIELKMKNRNLKLIHLLKLFPLKLNDVFFFLTKNNSY
jgi:hypothetical protein